MLWCSNFVVQFFWATKVSRLIFVQKFQNLCPPPIPSPLFSAYELKIFHHMCNYQSSNFNFMALLKLIELGGGLIVKWSQMLGVTLLKFELG